MSNLTYKLFASLLPVSRSAKNGQIFSSTNSYFSHLKEFSMSKFVLCLTVKDWYGYLQNNTIADAILDRIVNSSHRIFLDGDSLRPKYGKIVKDYE